MARFRKDRSAEPDNASEVSRISIDKYVIRLGQGVVHEAGPTKLYLFLCCHLISAQEKATPAAKPQNAEAANKAVVAKLEEEMENGQKDIDRIVEDQGRLRENMKALRGSAEEKALLQRYSRQLDEQETQLDALRKKIQDTEAQRDKANNALEKMIDELQIEATM